MEKYYNSKLKNIKASSVIKIATDQYTPSPTYLLCKIYAQKRD